MSTRSTTNRVAQAMHDIVDETAEKAETFEAQLRENASSAGEDLEAGQDLVQQQIDESLAKVERFVKEQPVASAGIAFAAGIVVSAMLRR